jgi:hypothetical protein
MYNKLQANNSLELPYLSFFFLNETVVPLLKGHPFCNENVVLQKKGSILYHFTISVHLKYSLIRGRPLVGVAL